MECNPFGSRPSVRLAVALAMRWPTLQPLGTNCSSFPISGICGRARRWDAADHGGFVGDSLVTMSRPPWHTIWHPCPRDWAVSAGVRQGDSHQLRTGLRGPMLCPCCRRRQPQSSRASWQGFHEVVWESCTPHAGFWTVKVSWAGQPGRSCWQVRVLYHLKPQTLAQYYASSTSEHYFGENVELAQSHASDQAHLRQDPELEQCSTELRLGSNSRCTLSSSSTLVLERLRLPLLFIDATCECGGQNDLLGRQRAACPRSGRLKRRALPTEITLARVCREVGATVRRNVKLRDMNVHVDPSDEREVEMLAAGLPIRHGAQLAVDITLRSALTCCGAPRPNAVAVDGAVLTQARRDKEAKYSELVAAERCCLVAL